MLHSNANAVPLGSEIKVRISKFLFIDLGLLLSAQGLPAQDVMNEQQEFTKTIGSSCCERDNKEYENMKLLLKVAFYVLIPISLAAGFAKLFKTQQEIDFFTQAGLSVRAMVALGCLQILGGVLALISKNRVNLDCLP